MPSGEEPSADGDNVSRGDCRIILPSRYMRGTAVFGPALVAGMATPPEVEALRFEILKFLSTHQGSALPGNARAVTLSGDPGNMVQQTLGSLVVDGKVRAFTGVDGGTRCAFLPPRG